MSPFCLEALKSVILSGLVWCAKNGQTSIGMEMTSHSGTFAPTNLVGK